MHPHLGTVAHIPAEFSTHVSIQVSLAEKIEDLELILRPFFNWAGSNPNCAVSNSSSDNPDYIAISPYCRTCNIEEEHSNLQSHSTLAAIQLVAKPSFFHARGWTLSPPPEWNCSCLLPKFSFLGLSHMCIHCTGDILLSHASFQPRHWFAFKIRGGECECIVLWWVRGVSAAQSTTALALVGDCMRVLTLLPMVADTNAAQVHIFHLKWDVATYIVEILLLANLPTSYVWICWTDHISSS